MLGTLDQLEIELMGYTEADHQAGLVHQDGTESITLDSVTERHATQPQ